MICKMCGKRIRWQEDRKDWRVDSQDRNPLFPFICEGKGPGADHLPEPEHDRVQRILATYEPHQGE